MGARSAAASVVRHVGGVAAEATLVAALVATVALAFSPVYAPAKFAAGTGGAFAASGGKNAPTASSTITFNGPAAYGGTANFTVVDPPSKNVQEISVNCAVGGQSVYLDVHTQNDANWTTFPMWSQPWQDTGGGSASCTAKLFYYTWQGHTETGIVYEDSTTFPTT